MWNFAPSSLATVLCSNPFQSKSRVHLVFGHTHHISSLLQHNSAYCRALLSTGAGPKAPTIWLWSGAVVHLAWTTFMGTSGLQQPMHFLSTVSRSNSTYSSFFELDMSILTPPCSPFFPTLHSRKTVQFIWGTLRSVLSCFVRVWIFFRISDAVPIAEVLKRVCDQVGGPDNWFSAFQLFGRQCPGPKQRSRVWPDRSRRPFSRHRLIGASAFFCFKEIGRHLKVSVPRLDPWITRQWLLYISWAIQVKQVLFGKLMEIAPNIYKHLKTIPQSKCLICVPCIELVGGALTGVPGIADKARQCRGPGRKGLGFQSLQRRVWTTSALVAEQNRSSWGGLRDVSFCFAMWGTTIRARVWIQTRHDGGITQDLRNIELEMPAKLPQKIDGGDWIAFVISLLRAIGSTPSMGLFRDSSYLMAPKSRQGRGKDSLTMFSQMAWTNRLMRELELKCRSELNKGMSAAAVEAQIKEPLKNEWRGKAIGLDNGLASQKLSEAQLLTPNHSVGRLWNTTE